MEDAATGAKRFINLSKYAFLRRFVAQANSWVNYMEEVKIVKSILEKRLRAWNNAAFGGFNHNKYRRLKSNKAVAWFYKPDGKLLPFGLLNRYEKPVSEDELKRPPSKLIQTVSEFVSEEMSSTLEGEPAGILQAPIGIEGMVYHARGATQFFENIFAKRNICAIEVGILENPFHEMEIKYKEIMHSDGKSAFRMIVPAVNFRNYKARDFVELLENYGIRVKGQHIAYNEFAFLVGIGHFFYLIKDEQKEFRPNFGDYALVPVGKGFMKSLTE